MGDKTSPLVYGVGVGVVCLAGALGAVRAIKVYQQEGIGLKVFLYIRNALLLLAAVSFAIGLTVQLIR